MSIEAYPSPNGVLTSLIWRKTAAGGETSLSGYDNASQALSYTPGQEQVYLNGILLVRGSDYTATNGTSITGLSALAADDFVQINCYNNFSVASVPTTSLTGEVTNSQITSLATTKLTGTITNAQLAGSIANDKLANSSITINGSAVALGGSATIAGGSAQDAAPSSPTEGQLWLDTDGTLASTNFVEKTTLTTTGDIFYASSANTPARLGIGNSSQVLTVSGGVPTWATPAGGGKVLQVVQATYATETTVASTTFTDTGLSASITPTLNTSKVLVLVTQGTAAIRDDNSNGMALRLLRGSTEIYNPVANAYVGLMNSIAFFNTQPGIYSSVLQNISYLDSPATTSSTTYKTQQRAYVTSSNGSSKTNPGGGTSSIILLEIGA